MAELPPNQRDKGFISEGVDATLGKTKSSATAIDNAKAQKLSSVLHDPTKYHYTEADARKALAQHNNRMLRVHLLSDPMMPFGDRLPADLQRHVMGYNSYKDFSPSIVPWNLYQTEPTSKDGKWPILDIKVDGDRDYKDTFGPAGSQNFVWEVEAEDGQPDLYGVDYTYHVPNLWDASGQRDASSDTPYDRVDAYCSLQ
jgi:hypothetical protein